MLRRIYSRLVKPPRSIYAGQGDTYIVKNFEDCKTSVVHIRYYESAAQVLLYT